jgi:LmbE family N-acetylglucosaminyl deacetylase
LTAIIKSVARIALGQRRIQSLRVLIRNSSLFTQETVVHEPGGGKIVVLAPHMDDETLGCGGTIARHVQAGAQLTVVFLTDGRRGGPSCAEWTDAERRDKQREIVGIRKGEARCAADILGVKSIRFLDAEDMRLNADVRVPKLLRQILEQEQPDCVYLPSFLEQHPDHRAANGVLCDAVAGTRLDFECRGYEVWTPLFANCVVKIDATMELKKRALVCYASQLAQMDYLHAAIGLNAHRSLALGGRAGRFAEAFHALRAGEYLNMYRAFPASMLP